MKPNEVKRMKLNRLVAHPAQEKNYGTPDPEAYARLKADIAIKGGIEKPIEVMPPINAAGLPAYTIVAGHTRLRILKELQHQDAPVLIRHDLAEATASEVEIVLIGDNLNRRQESKLAQARHAVRLFELRSGRNEVDPMQVPRLKEEIGLILGMSGRNLTRYLSLLATPAVIQAAFERGEITLNDGARLGGLPPHDIANIVRRIEDGESTKDVAKEYLAPSPTRHRRATPPFRLFIAAAIRALADLEGRRHMVYIVAIRDAADTLASLRDAIDEWLTRLDQVDKKETDGTDGS